LFHHDKNGLGDISKEMTLAWLLKSIVFIADFSHRRPVMNSIPNPPRPHRSHSSVNREFTQFLDRDNCSGLFLIIQGNINQVAGTLHDKSN
jgi:hypothetical protein